MRGPKAAIVYAYPVNAMVESNKEQGDSAGGRGVARILKGKASLSTDQAPATSYSEAPGLASIAEDLKRQYPS